MDFKPPFQWHPVSLEQHASDDPSFESLSSLLSYDHTTGRLGSDLTIAIDGSDDDTDDEVVLREEVWIDVHLPAGFSGDLPVGAEFETVAADQKFLKIDDEAGFSDLTISWKSMPYATSGFPKDHRVYDRVLAEGYNSWGGFSAAPVNPNPSEPRMFVLRDLKGTVRIGVGIEHTIFGHSNDYSYEVRSIGDFILSKITINVG